MKLPLKPNTGSLPFIFALILACLFYLVALAACGTETTPQTHSFNTQSCTELTANQCAVEPYCCVEIVSGQGVCRNC
jgi:hypothetical protein